LFFLIIKHTAILSLKEIHINFSDENLFFLNLSLAFIMFGVALSIRRSNFVSIFEKPKAVAAGVISQFILLPALTFLLVLLFDPLPGLALGMILVAACPGGNVSNFFSSVARGNIALSVTLTAIATLSAPLMTPLNFELWGSLLENRQGVSEIEISYWDMFKSVMIVLAIPLILGILFATRFPKITEIIKKPIKIISFLILAGFIILAFYANLDIFMEYSQYVILLVFVHNAVALSCGYLFSRLLGCKVKEARTVSIETGIQNSGLGLLIIFTLFDGHGGMAIITAWWGIWHIISGMFLALIFNYRTRFTLST
jgi:BASS family bile acid:Na+ symporter